MNSVKLMRVLWMLVALLCLGVTRTVGATSSSALQCGGWSIVPSPNPYNAGNGFYSVDAISAHDVWAVGVGANSSSPAQTLIEHWDGTSWQVVSSPNAGASGLEAVAALSANNLWAVGYAQAEAQTLIEHWDGARWSIVPSPSVGAYYNDLTGVAAVSSRDVWAVGYDKLSLSSPEHTLVEHWDGMQWHIVKSPNPGATYSVLFGVAAVSSQDVWTVGYYAVGRYGQVPLVEHWDGTKWSRVHDVPGTKGRSTGLFAVTALQANNVWAVGNYGSGDTTTDQWDGQRWHHVPSPNPQHGNASPLSSVAAASSTDIWTVSSYTDFDHGYAAQTVTEHWDGTQWSLAPSPNMQDAAGQTNLDNFLYGVANVPGTNTFWAVGYYGPHDGYTDKTLIEYYC